ncbi:MAG: protein-tyrosine-phosphatase [Bacteroidota bacterium]
MNTADFYPNLGRYIENLPVHTIGASRKTLLEEMASYLNTADAPKLNFICTHNSRRSHLSQIWAQVAAHSYGVSVTTFSGGTEATAFNPNAVAALDRAGFQITNPGGDNPKYEVTFGEEIDPMVNYSKKFDEAPNPTKDFAAIMTCSEADAECPVVFGASKRIKLFYEDPKVADGTPEEGATYDERCKQIATEMFYLFSLVNKK